MKHYKVFENLKGEREAVKVGWSWPAFFFNIIWALVKKMYLLGIGLLVAFFVLGLVGGNEPAIDVIIRIANLVLAIIFGSQGNKWRVSNLQSRGFDLKDTISAATPENAISLYLKQKVSQSLSLGNETKKCPACAETIKLEAKKCRFCGEEMDTEEIERQLAIKRAELEAGKKQCPQCKNWDVYQAMLKDGGMGDYCPQCKKSLTAIVLEMPSVTTINHDQISLDNETKKCPICAETIKLEAKKCRFCGEEMDTEEIESQLAIKRAELEAGKETEGG